MIRTGLSSLLSAIFVTSLVGTTSADSLNSLQPRWTPQVLQSLSAGEPVLFYPHQDPEKGGTLAGAIHIESTRGDVWNVISDPASHPKYLKNIKRSSVTSAGGNHVYVDHQLKFSFLPVTVKYRYMLRKSPVSEVNFHLVSGDLRDLRGGWRIFDASPILGKEGVVAFYRIHLDPGGLVPSSMVRNNLKGDLPAMLLKTRDRVYKLSGGVAMR